MAGVTSRIGTPTNLPTGATYDLLFISYVAGFPQGQIKFDIGDTPRKITGVQKVAQTFLKVLFTSKGSDPVYPNRGTGFPALTVNANVLESDDLFYADLTSEVRNAESQTKYILNTLQSDAASQLSAATVLSLDIADDSVVMYIKIVTGAGETASIAVPFPQLDLPITDV